MAEDKMTKIRMNLAAIQKVDPYAKEIIDSSSHVAYYTFKDDWEKTDIEGN
jgi:mRNA-decapping enzyme 1B